LLWATYPFPDSKPRPRRFGNIVLGAFTPVLAKHSKSFSLVDAISVGVDRMQRNFEPMRKQVELWQQSESRSCVESSFSPADQKLAAAFFAAPGLHLRRLLPAQNQSFTE
jgi:hypothetical protein